VESGWIRPDEAPALPVTSMLLAGGRGEQPPGSVLETVLARSRAADAREAREAEAAAPEPMSVPPTWSHAVTCRGR